MGVLLAGIALSVLLVLLYETNVLEAGALAGSANMEFLVLSAMEILVLAMIPLALRLFKFSAIRRQLTATPEPALKKWGIVRLLMFLVPMVACTWMYYLFFMKAAFGYLTIILLICLGFVVPTMDKCNAETKEE